MLFHRWKTAGLKVGDRIESQNEIIEICDFSLITVVKTLKDLEAEGVIRRQVGKGSFLLKAPWAETFYRIGLFYNRDVVGGGIFNNAFYTQMVMAFEKQVVSDGHAFVMGSFTHDKMPVEVFEALDVIVLTSLTADTSLEPLEGLSTQVCVVDQVLELPKVHSYRIDYFDAYCEMFRHLGDAPRRYLYLDSEIATTEQAQRRAWVDEAMREGHPDNELRVIKIDQEHIGSGSRASIARALAHYPAEVIFGYTNDAWVQHLNVLAPGALVYSYSLRSDGNPGFIVDPREWMADVLPQVYANFEDRTADARVHSFKAKFRP